MLTWARAHIGFRAVVDDRAARRCCAALGLPVLGTLGVLVLARQRGLVPALAPVVQEIVAAGLHVDTATRSRALLLVGET